MSIIKNLISFSDEFIDDYEGWYYDNFKDDFHLWDFKNLADFFKWKSNNKYHFFIANDHVTVEEIKEGKVKYFTGKRAYLKVLRFHYKVYNEKKVDSDYVK